MTTPEFGRILSEENVEFGRPLEKKQPKLSLTERASKKTKAGAGGRAISRGLLKGVGGILDLLTPKVDPERFPEERFSLEKAVDVLLPQAEDAGFVEKTLERGGTLAPFLLGGEGALAAKLGRTGLAALLGQTTEEAGGGPIAQTVAELGGLGLPGLGKKILPKKSQKEALKMLRRRGLTEKEIAPLIPSQRKSALLGKLGTRNFRTAKAAKRTRDALGNLYGQLAEEGEKLPILSSNRASLLESQLETKLEKMPSTIRRAIKEDVEDLFKKPVKANDLMNFWQDINSQINWKTIGGGKKRLNGLKDVLLEGMKDIDPQLASDFAATNRQFIQFNKLYKNLKPQSLDRWMALGEAGALLGGLFKFGPKGAATVIGADALRRLSSEMLINPRLQNLTRQMGTALNKNKIAIAKKIQDQMIKELKKEGIDLPVGPVPNNLQKSSPANP